MPSHEKGPIGIELPAYCCPQRLPKDFPGTIDDLMDGVYQELLDRYLFECTEQKPNSYDTVDAPEGLYPARGNYDISCSVYIGPGAVQGHNQYVSTTAIIMGGILGGLFLATLILVLGGLFLIMLIIGVLVLLKLRRPLGRQTRGQQLDVDVEDTRGMW